MSAPMTPEQRALRESRREENKRKHAEQTEERKKLAAERRAEAAAAAVLARSLRKKQAARKGVEFSVELGLEVCRRIASGQTPTLVCDDPAMPTRAQLGEWAAERPEFAASLDRALATRRQVLREMMPLIASGEVGYSSGDSVRDRLIIDNILRELDRPPEFFGQGPPDETDEPDVSYKDMQALEFLIAEGDARLQRRLEATRNASIGPQQRLRHAPLNDPLTNRMSLHESLAHTRDVVSVQPRAEDAPEEADRAPFLRHTSFAHEQGLGDASPRIIRHRPR